MAWSVKYDPGIAGTNTPVTPSTGAVGLVGQAVQLALGIAPASGSLTIAGQVPSVVASGGTTDPFSSYTSYIADTSFAGTDGTVTTVSWNGATITGPTYKPDANGTCLPACNAAAAVNGGAGQRVCLLLNQVWAKEVAPPGEGTGPSALFVIQGDPASTAATQPYIDGQNTPSGYANANTTAIRLGAYISGGSPVSRSNKYVCIYNVGFKNFTDGTAGAAFITLHNGGGNTDGAQVLYCNGNYIRGTGAGGENGAVVTTDHGDSSSLEIGYCTFYDCTQTSGVANYNCVLIGIYGTVPHIHHCRLYGSYSAFHIKFAPTVVPNGIVFERNIVSDCPGGMFSAEAGGEDVGYNGVEISNCLMVWTHFNDTLYGSPADAAFYSDFGALSNTSAPLNVTIKNVTVSSDIGKASATYSALLNTVTGNVTVKDNVFLGANPIQVTSLYTKTTDVSLTWSAGVATVTLTGGNSLPLGMPSTWTGYIRGVTPSGYNGTFTCTKVSSTVYTYPLASNPGGAATVLGVMKYALGSFSECDYNYYFNPTVFYPQLNGTPGSVSGLAAWKSVHTNYPAFLGLSADPDTHGGDISLFSAPYNTIAGCFPSYASYNYQPAAGCPLLTASSTGGPVGYDWTDCGPG